MLCRLPEQCYDARMTDAERIAILRDYAAGRLGTRTAIERAGLTDFADLIIALSQNDLRLPRPEDTPLRRAHRERAEAILLPRLLHAD